MNKVKKKRIMLLTTNEDIIYTGDECLMAPSLLIAQNSQQIKTQIFGDWALKYQKNIQAKFGCLELI